MIRYKQKQYSEEYKSLFLAFLCQLEGWKCRCKNLHWSAPKKNIHVYLDEFLDILSNYQDSLAEGYMGLFEQLDPTDLEGTLCASNNALDFIEEVREGVLKFYKRIPEGTEFKGITGETESLIQDINKYNYLFKLCFDRGGGQLSKEFSDKDNNGTKALVAGGVGTAGLLTTKMGRLTDKVTRYHNTDVKNVDSILKEGIKAKYSTDPNNITNQVVWDIPMSEKEGLVYTAKNKNVAESVGKQRERLGLSGKHKTLKLEFDYDDIKNLGKIKNPELRGAKNAKEFYERVPKGILAKSSWKDLSPVEKEIMKKSFENLDEGTHIFRGDISSKNIVGGQGYKKRTLKQVGKYIKNNPARFAKEAGKVGASLTALGYAGKKVYDHYKNEK